MLLPKMFGLRLCLTSLLLTLILSSSLSAKESTTFQNPDDLGQWITFYYIEPNASRVADAFLFASKSGLFKDGNAAPPFFGFLAGWLATNKELADALVEKLIALPADDQPVLVLGLWYSNTPESKAMLKKYAPRLPTQEKLIAYLVENTQIEINEIPLEEGPWVLDALWGNFMATGTEAPIIRIISALPWATVKGDIPRLLVGGSAKWSLTSNAVQHPRVLEICRSRLSRQPEHESSPLAEVVRQAEKQLQEKNPSGN